MSAVSKAVSSSGPLPFLIAAVINFLWINISEIFRYFVFVMPMMREAFPEMQTIAPMNILVFMLWGLWDTILVLCVTGFIWLYLGRFGLGARSVLSAGSAVTLGIFGILWLGLYNMNLATLEILAIALPLAWIEMIIAAFIVRWRMRVDLKP